MDLFVPLMFFIITFLVVSIVYIVYGSRHREKMAMIEKGMNPDQYPLKKNKTEILKWGMFLIGLGIGFLIAFILDQFVFVSIEATEPLFPSMIAIFGGLALILYYVLFSGK